MNTYNTDKRIKTYKYIIWGIAIFLLGYFTYLIPGRIAVNEMRGTTFTYSEGDTLKDLISFYDNVREKGYKQCVVKDAPDEFINIVDYIIDGTPEYYDITLRYNTYGNINVVYFMDIYNDSEYIWKECNRYADEIISKMPEGLSELQKAEYLHNYLCINTDAEMGYKAHDEGNIDGLGMYNVFANGYSVCYGYSQAFAFLLDKAGIENNIVAADYDGMGHAWNSYVIDGITYYADVTWDDSCQDENGKFYDNSLGLYSNYWLNKTYDEFTDHKFCEYTYPTPSNSIEIAQKD